MSETALARHPVPYFDAQLAAMTPPEVHAFMFPAVAASVHLAVAQTASVLAPTATTAAQTGRIFGRDPTSDTHRVWREMAHAAAVEAARGGSSGAGEAGTRQPRLCISLSLLPTISLILSQIMCLSVFCLFINLFIVCLFVCLLACLLVCMYVNISIIFNFFIFIAFVL